MRRVSKRIGFWLTVAFSLAAIFTTAISTMAWFTLVSPPASNMVTGSSDVNIDSVTGYKIPEVRDSKGFVKTDNTTVVKKQPESDEYKTTNNPDIGAEDLNFDVPAGGVGYYVVTQNSAGSFKFVESEGNYKKLTELDNCSAMYAENIDLSTSTPFQIRSYTMKNFETQVGTVTIAGVNTDSATLSQNAITAKTGGRYKIWFDSNTNKVGVERTGEIPTLGKISQTKNLIDYGDGLHPNRIVLVVDFNWGNITDVQIGFTNLNSIVSQTTIGNSYYGVTGKYYWCPENITSTQTSLYFKFIQYESNVTSYFYPTNDSGTMSYDAKYPGTVNFEPGKVYRIHSITYVDQIGDSWNDGGWKANKKFTFSIEEADSLLTSVQTVVSGTTYNMEWDSTNNEWYKQIPTIADNASLSFKKNGEGISVTKQPDASYDLLSVNNLNSTASAIPGGGSNLKIYLHQDNTVWVESATTMAKVKIGSGTAQAMTYDSTKEEWSYTASTVATNDELVFTYAGLTQTVTASANTSGQIYNMNNFNAGKIIRGGSNVTIFLNKNRKVWVSTVYELLVGATTYQATMITSGDDDYNSNSRQYKATYSGSAGDAVKILVNGTATAYSIDGDITAPAYNNIQSYVTGSKSSSLYRDATSESAFIKINGTDASPTWTAASLFVHGNKSFAVNDGSADYPLSYVGSGTWNGWYSVDLTPTNATPSNALSFTLNGDAISVTAANGDDNNFNGSTKRIKTGDGNTQVTVYLNPGNNQVFITPIYQVTINGTTKAAPYYATNTYRATGFTVEDGWTVQVKRNGAAYGAYETTKAYNNINSGMTILADNTNVYVDIYSDTGKVWVSGYHDPEYYVRINTGSFVKMDAGSSTGEFVLENQSLSEGDVLTFRENLHGSVTATAETGNRNNVKNENSAITVKTATTDGDIYLKTGSSPFNVWVTGMSMTAYFYNGNQSMADSLGFNLSCSNDGTTWTKIGALVHDESDPRLMTAIIPIGNYGKMAFHTGDTWSGSAYRSALIEIDQDSQEGKYCHATSAATDFAVKWFDNPPNNSAGSRKLYFYDTTGKLGSTPYARVWDSNESYMDYKGAAEPGFAMDELIPGSLWIVKTNSTYDKVQLMNSAGTDKTSVIDFTGVSGHDGDVAVPSADISNHILPVNYCEDKTISVGVIEIRIITNNVVVGRKTMFVGDSIDGVSGSNKFIYERGILAKNNSKIELHYFTDEAARAAAETAGTDGEKRNKVVYGMENRPYLSASGVSYEYEEGHSGEADHVKSTTVSSLSVNLGSDADAEARFNFYVNKNDEVSIVMVPKLGNGYYIMPYEGSTDGFVGAKKMNSTSNESGIYAGYFAEKGDQIFIRSYLDAKDKIYTLTGTSSDFATCENNVITFEATNYYNIEAVTRTVDNTTYYEVSISEFSFDEFFQLNPLDKSRAGSQSAILAQKTSIILEIAFTTTDNSFEMTPYLDVSNEVSDYVGVAASFTKTQVQETESEGVSYGPYEYMRESARYNDTTNGMLKRGSNFSLSQEGFKTEKHQPNKIYYIYVAIDYVYSSSLATMPYEIGAGRVLFTVRTQSPTSIAA